MAQTALAQFTFMPDFRTTSRHCATVRRISPARRVALWTHEVQAAATCMRQQAVRVSSLLGRNRLFRSDEEADWGWLRAQSAVEDAGKIFAATLQPEPGQINLNQFGAKVTTCGDENLRLHHAGG
jgi:hypothetical protein